MAGHVPRRVLHKPEVHKCLLEGLIFFKCDEGDAPLQKLTFYADKDAFFLWAKGTSPKQNYENMIWDMHLISDVRFGKPRKAVYSLLGKEVEDFSDDVNLTLVFRRDGIVYLDYIHLIARTPEVAEIFKNAVNALTLNMLNAHASPENLLKKHYLKIKLHADGEGNLLLKYVNKLMNIRNNSDSVINQWLAGFQIVKETTDGKTKFVHTDDFTEDLFFRMVDQLLHSRTNDVDVVFSALSSKSKRTPQLTLKEFHSFLNNQQRDPRLNEILHPLATREQAMKIIAKYERGKSDRLSIKGLMEYLMSEDNNVIDVEHLNQTHDMGQPLSHYFINSSHNTYLTGHQLKSLSTSEMYIQCLLLGCRCVELDCWPENDSIIITHGGTFCGKVAFEEVVQAIAEFAFVSSEYPLILSIENHCRRHPRLMQHMANTFRLYFGDKLLSQPLDEYPLEAGIALPPPEKLKFKILIKDKLIRKKGDGALGGTLMRGANLNLDGISEDSLKKKGSLDGTESCLLPIVTEGDASFGAKSDATAASARNGEEDNASAERTKESSNAVATSGEGECLVNGVMKEEAKEVEDFEEQKVEVLLKDGGGSEVVKDGGVSKVVKDGGESEVVKDGGVSEVLKDGEVMDGGGSDVGGGDAEEVGKKNDMSVVEGSTEERTSCRSEAKDDTKMAKDDLKLVQRTRSSVDGPASMFSIQQEPDITTINVALIHQRGSEVEGISGPLAEILNYTTGITFEGFSAAEKTNCHFYMSSFVEEKGLNHIKTKPKDIVKYNMRQLSRIYPQGARINSSNYMPVIYWSVGCQMVALNFQTSDLPVQINTAKFEFNGNTGYQLKPWVMNREAASRGVFTPFVQSKLEDIVPAKLKVKVISGYFLTHSDKKTSCYVEVDLYGIPADIVRHKFYTKKCAGPHPFWNEDFFVFKRILLPEMAMLRIGVCDDDKELIGTRVLPLNAIRPGFRHIGLRDKHNIPLPLEMLFVQISVEDWVPNEMEILVAMLMDPISFANSALLEMVEGLDASEEAFGAVQGGKGKMSGGGKSLSKVKSNRTTPKYTGNRKTQTLPGKLDKESGDVASYLLPPQLPPSSGQSAGFNTASPNRNKNKMKGLFDKGLFDNTLPCLETACNRAPPEAIVQESKLVLGHQDFIKVDKKHSKQRAATTKQHEKTLKQVRIKMNKGQADERDLKVLKKSYKLEIINFYKACSAERYEKKRMIIEEAHKTQLKDLKEKTHKSDLASLSKDLAITLKKCSKDADLKENKKQSMREIEDRIIEMGRKARNDFEVLHTGEISKLEEKQKLAVLEVVKTQAKELDDLNEELTAMDREATPM